MEGNFGVGEFILLVEENLANSLHSQNKIIIICSVKHQFSDIGLCNQLLMKHKRCILKQTRSFAGNILKSRTLANRDKLQ